MLNEPLVIMLLGTGLALGAAKARRWRAGNVRAANVAGGEGVNSHAEEDRASLPGNLIIEAGADLV
ncbi:MAG: hypothetical protein WCD76_16305 [Pyrinomonadaceae bacterium]